MTVRAIAPYGAWASPIRIGDVVGDVIGLAEPWLDGDETYRLEPLEMPGLDRWRARSRSRASGPVEALPSGA
jgi:hypothetical protein